MAYQGITVVIFFQLSFLFVAQVSAISNPFYLIAHMANTRSAVDWALSQGANAIENDIQFDINGNPTTVEHRGICDCICAILSGHICTQVLNRQCSGSDASNDAANQMQYIASRTGIALYYIDSKVEAEWGNRLDKAGAAIVPFVDNNLFNYGYKGKVLISAPKVDVYNYIQAAVVAASNSANKDRYFFTFDEEGGDYQGVIAMLSRLTKNRIYSTGSSACSPLTYDSAINSGINGKNLGENGLTIIWNFDLDSNIKKYIDRGVQGIMTNRVGVARDIVNKAGLTLADNTTSIPVSTVDISSPNKCSCAYHDDGCMISWPAPNGKACKCTKIIRICVGSVVSCDSSQAKCANPDESKEACQLGKGNCGGYN